MWAEWQVVPVADAGGRHTHSVAVLRDITERHRAEQALRESEARFRGLFEQAADGIFVLDRTAKSWTPTARRAGASATSATN